MESHIAVFQQKEIRKTFHGTEWWFVITDVVAALTDSPSPAGYLKDMRRRDPALAEALKGGANCPPLSLEAPTAGGPQKMLYWNTAGILRLIQPIPSPKAEPFKLWLARVGHDRIREIENPGLAMQRIREIYRAKGYSDAWIDKRMRGIAIRDELTQEWKSRGVREHPEYAILTSESAAGITWTSRNQRSGSVCRRAGSAGREGLPQAPLRPCRAPDSRPPAGPRCPRGRWTAAPSPPPRRPPSAARE